MSHFRVVCVLIFAYLCGLSTCEWATDVGVDAGRVMLDGKPAFLLGISYYGGLGASDESIAKDLDDMKRYGFNWLRVWATWTSGGSDVSAVDCVSGKTTPEQ